MTTPSERDSLHPYSNSRLVNYNQCPTWGAVSSERHYESEVRAMALEAGATMHQVFAALRCWQLWRVQGLPHHAAVAGARLFGKERWSDMTKDVGRDDSDLRAELVQMAFECLHSSGFYDDARDSIRTLSNMELASIRYIDERLAWMEQWPIFVEGVTHTENGVKGRAVAAERALIGIEQTFDVVLHYADGEAIRYIGTIDGLSYSTYYKRHFLDENKTAIRLDEGWRRSFEMQHQITGYCAASTAVFSFPVFDAHVFGVKLKPGGRVDDLYTFQVTRTGNAIQHWANWVRHTVEVLARPYEGGKFEDAPRYTHSCNRYFRPCALIAFCSDTPEGRVEQFESMVPAEPSPSERAIMEQF